MLFAGALALVRRFLARRDDRRLGLVLALFACSPVAALVGWAGLGNSGDKLQVDFITGELWAGSYLWGYLFTAIAVGLLAAGAARLRARSRRRRSRCDGGGGGRRAAVRLAAAVAGRDVRARRSWRRSWWSCDEAARRRARARDLALPLAATAAPLVYYALLGHYDPAWELAARVNELPRWPWWVLLAGLAPLALPAAFAYRLPAPGFGAVALRFWPLAALLVYFQPFGTFPFHALQGLTPPLVVLAMLALRAHLGGRPVPLGARRGGGHAARRRRHGLPRREPRRRRARRAPAVHARAGERAALRHLDERRRARRRARAGLHRASRCPPTPAARRGSARARGRPTSRSAHAQAEALFGGRLDAAAAEALVRRSRARFLLSDCHGRADISELLAGFTEPPRRFGCASVWEVR